ncbi:MAG: epoxyqueuosine reductase [Clostridia bacterium]|nr:epoxyqueuosine reductase [Clostridia bacterium]
MISYDVLKKLNVPCKVVTFTDAKVFLTADVGDTAETVVVFLMPYTVGREKGNVSYYAKGMDYHKRAVDIAQNISEIGKFKVYADVSPFKEIDLAAACGLGVKGKNGLLINEDYGSFVFIGEILLDDTFDKYDEISEIRGCLNCGRCEAVCLANAINDKERCISHITQKKGLLTEEEASLIKKSGYIWGCDMCQSVCPMNKLTDEAPLSLEMGDVADLSNREFKEKYKDFAFTWRGVKPLQRNLEILNKK